MLLFGKRSHSIPTRFDSLILPCRLRSNSWDQIRKRSALRQALALRPDDPLTLVKCGDILDRNQKPDAAMKMFDRALEILSELSRGGVEQGHLPVTAG